MSRLALFLVLVLPLMTSPAAAQISPVVQLLALACVEVDDSQASILQFEREVFPPFSDTGLFAANGQELLFVERGPLTVTSDRNGSTLAGNDYSFLAAPNSTLAVRNDDFGDGSVLWFRYFTPPTQSQIVPFAAPHVLHALRAAAPVTEPLQPRFVEFELEHLVNLPPGIAYLFMARMSFESFAAFDVIEHSLSLTKSGTIAFIVDSGELTVDDGAARHVLGPGQHQVVDGAGLYSAFAGETPAEVFLVGVIALDDNGDVGAAIGESVIQSTVCGSR